MREIRIAEDGDRFRIIYVAKFEEAVYVLHAFEKKTQKTPKRNLDLATARFKALQQRRRKEKAK